MSLIFNSVKPDIKASWYTGNITVRIGERDWIKDDNSDRNIGRKYEAVVYVFNKGQLVSRSIKEISDMFKPIKTVISK